MALTDNLEAYWKLDESSGDAADEVNGNTLTNNNTATFSTGIINNGVDLERSSSQYLSAADSVSLSLTTDFSIQLWVKFESLLGANNETALISKWGSSQRSYILSLDTFGGNFIDGTISSTGSNADTRQWSWSPSTATWYHVVWTFNNSTKNNILYIDGSSLGNVTSTLSPFNSSAQFQIGYRAEGSINYLDGMVDEVALWSRELTSAEVTSLYNSGAGLAYPFTVAGATKKNLTLLGVS